MNPDNDKPPCTCLKARIPGTPFVYIRVYDPFCLGNPQHKKRGTYAGPEPVYG